MVTDAYQLEKVQQRSIECALPKDFEQMILPNRLNFQFVVVT